MGSRSSFWRRSAHQRFEAYITFRLRASSRRARLRLRSSALRCSSQRPRPVATLGQPLSMQYLRGITVYVFHVPAVATGDIINVALFPLVEETHRAVLIGEQLPIRS